MTKHLTVVPEGAKAKPETPKSISSALDGTGRDVLAAMRKALAEKLDAGEIASNAIASSYSKLQELDGLIRGIDAEREAEEAKRAEVSRPRRSFNSSAI